MSHLPSDEELAELGLTAEEAMEIITPIAIGPTWERTPLGAWKLPERTLGWQIAGWAAEWLLAKGGGPWKFTSEQMRFLLWWYAVDETGEFVYRTGVLQRLKGWGKDPTVAVMCLIELVGPSRFGGWDASGQPVGVPHPQAWVQVAAVNQDQTRNTMTLLPSLMSDRFIQHFGIDPGAVLIRADNGRKRLEAVTSSFRALEGGRATFVVINESHHWVRGNNGDKMYETIDGNITKMDGRYLAITNAYLPGENSVAEKMREAYEKIIDGRTVDVSFLYDSLEASPKAPLKGPLLPYVLRGVRGDAKWLKIPTIMKSIANSTMAPSRSRRMWLNQIVAEEESLHGPETWDVLRHSNDSEFIKPGDDVTLGFDGGKTDDATALVAIRCKDGFAVPIGVWEKPDGPEGDGWEIDRTLVNNAVHDAFRTYNVVGFYADVALWEADIADWSASYGELLHTKANAKDSISWDMRSSIQRSTRAHERLMASIFNGGISHNGDRTLRRHVLNARRKVNNYGLSFTKESKDSPRKVDAYAALMLAHEAWTDWRTSTKKAKKKPTGRGYFL
ncbi:MAG: hypothetical protein ACRCYU_12180 [Nocardioides sp.]